MIKPKEFIYDTGLISKEAFLAHVELYHGHVDTYNHICNELKQKPQREHACKNYSEFRSLKLEESYNINSITFHEYYFKNISKNTTTIDQQFISMIQDEYNNIQTWQEDFIACAKSARGWAACVFEQRTKRIMNVVYDSYNTEVILNSFPLLVIDMYEHAYYTDYKNDREKYINEFFSNVNWQTVNERVGAISGH